MFRLNKIIALSLVISILFLLCACNQEKNNQPKTQKQEAESKFKFESVSDPLSIPKQKVKTVLAPVETSKYIYLNAIKIEHTKFNDEKISNKDAMHYVKISGLANKEIENKINKKIYDECIALYNRGLPPYRGIRTIATDDMETAAPWIYVNGNSNIANIFSVYINKDTQISNKAKKQFSIINDVVTLNFNLKNGELINLSDLFADNCDYKKIINQQILKYLLSKNADSGDIKKNTYDDMGMGQIEVVSPFNGISDNQKYYISGEDIYIVVDYNMPEFNTNFRGIPIRIDSKNPEVEKNLALFTRFETNDESLYDKSIKRQKNLRNLNYDAKEERIIYGNGKDLGLEYKDLEVSMFLTIPKQIEVKSLDNDFNKKFNQAKDKFISLIKDKKSQYPNNRMLVSYTYCVNEIGKYLTEEEYDWIHIDLNDGKDSYVFQTSNMALYDNKTGKKLDFADVFKNRFDYKSAMYDIIHKKNYNNFTDEEIKNLIETNNFKLNSEGIDISDVQSKDGKPKNSYHITFSDLGYENLAIFD